MGGEWRLVGRGGGAGKQTRRTFVMDAAAVSLLLRRRLSLVQRSSFSFVSLPLLFDFSRACFSLIPSFPALPSAWISFTSHSYRSLSLSLYTFFIPRLPVSLFFLSRSRGRVADTDRREI